MWEPIIWSSGIAERFNGPTDGNPNTHYKIYVLYHLRVGSKFKLECVKKTGRWQWSISLEKVPLNILKVYSSNTSYKQIKLIQIKIEKMLKNDKIKYNLATWQSIFNRMDLNTNIFGSISDKFTGYFTALPCQTITSSTSLIKL